MLITVKTNVDLLDTLSKTSAFSPGAFHEEKLLGTLERILKVLESGIVNSSRNAMYLVTYQRALLLKKLARLVVYCFQAAGLFKAENLAPNSFPRP